jgi:hypothetical protein
VALATIAPSSTWPKAVLIPQGGLSPRIASNHIEILAYPSLKNYIRYYIFEAKPTLGLLLNSGMLSSKLLICYLHTLASHCLPDPPTRRTGTETALRLLGSVALRSFQYLDLKSADYLQTIADLSLQRTYYPDHLQVMETALRLWAESSRLLVERARLRNAAFRVSEFGSEVSPGSCNDNQQNLSEYDHWYHCKDGRQVGPLKECNRASLVARCLDAGLRRSLFRP